MLREFSLGKIDKDDKIILYGAAMYGELALNALTNIGLEPFAFCDRVQGGGEFCGKRVLKPEQLEEYRDAKILICATKGLQGIAKYLEEIQWEAYYEISGLLEYMDYDRLSPYCRGLPKQELIDKYRFFVEGGHGERGFNLAFVALSITERCSLRCKKCSVLAPYYKRPCDDSFEEIIVPFGRFLKCIDSIAELQIGGGEPLLHRDFEKILDWCIGQNKIKEISIFTNSTIIPGEGVLEKLKNKKVKLLLDDYGELSRHFKELVQLCDEQHIRYVVQRFLHWDDLGDFKEEEKNLELVKQKFAYCSFANVISFLKGKLHRCTAAARIIDLNLIEEEPGDAVDFNQEKEVEILKKEIYDLLYCKEYHTACKLCKGISNKKEGIPVAEQIVGEAVL